MINVHPSCLPLSQLLSVGTKTDISGNKLNDVIRGTGHSPVGDRASMTGVVCDLFVLNPLYTRGVQMSFSVSGRLEIKGTFSLPGPSQPHRSLLVKQPR